MSLTSTETIRLIRDGAGGGGVGVGGRVYLKACPRFSSETFLEN